MSPLRAAASGACLGATAVSWVFAEVRYSGPETTSAVGVAVSVMAGLVGLLVVLYPGGPSE